MQVVTAAEMAETDRRTEAEFGVPLQEMMERAGEAVANFCLRHHGNAGRIAVLCGSGNNGGDGLVAARYLSVAGREVVVYLLRQPEDLQGPPRVMLGLLQSCVSAAVVALDSDVAVAEHAGNLGEFDLLLDAIVGTGFKPPLRGVAVGLRDAVARLPVPVVAVDLPSGWDADATTQQPEGGSEDQGASAAFRADAVVTFTAPKPAHVFGHLTAGKSFGPVVVAEIGSPDAAVVSSVGLTWSGAAKRLCEKPRNIDSNKGRFGHVLVVGGSAGKAGAPAMASLAALRAGAGLVTAAVPASILNTVALITPELMMTPLAEDVRGSASLQNLDEERLERLTKGITVLAIGPGLSTEGDASAFARTLVAKTTLPAVIDADALNAFAGKTQFLTAAAGAVSSAGQRRPIVLTPHPGEMARLAGLSVREVEADRVGLARQFATKHCVTLVLKGWRTLVAHPDGRVAVNTTGNPAMAKGGSGDILTGIVAAMLAQFPGDVASAVEAAVYLHGLAGDFAAIEMDEHTVLATDTLAHLSNAFRYRVKDADGLTWLCGLRERA